MPLKLSHLVADRRACAVDFGGGDVLTVEFYPRRLTGAMLVRFNAAAQASAAAESVRKEAARKAGAADAASAAEPPAAGDAAANAERTTALVTGVTDDLLGVLASWDLLGDDDRPLPIDRATLDGIGVAVQWAIFSAIMASGSGSDPGKASAPAGNG